jgi:hypothetical protein
MFSPPRMMMSLTEGKKRESGSQMALGMRAEAGVDLQGVLLSRMYTKPSSSTRPRSPVLNHPSFVRTYNTTQRNATRRQRGCMWISLITDTERRA